MPVYVCSALSVNAAASTNLPQIDMPTQLLEAIAVNEAND